MFRGYADYKLRDSYTSPAKRGGKEHDRAQWAIKGVCVGAVVKEIEQANSAMISLGTTRGLDAKFNGALVESSSTVRCV